MLYSRCCEIGLIQSYNLDTSKKGKIFEIMDTLHLLRDNLVGLIFHVYLVTILALNYVVICFKMRLPGFVVLLLISVNLSLLLQLLFCLWYTHPGFIKPFVLIVLQSSIRKFCSFLYSYIVDLESYVDEKYFWCDNLFSLLLIISFLLRCMWNCWAARDNHQQFIEKMQLLCLLPLLQGPILLS